MCCTRLYSKCAELLTLSPCSYKCVCIITRWCKRRPGPPEQYLYETYRERVRHSSWEVTFTMATFSPTLKLNNGLEIPMWKSVSKYHHRQKCHYLSRNKGISDDIKELSTLIALCTMDLNRPKIETILLKPDFTGQDLPKAHHIDSLARPIFASLEGSRSMTFLSSKRPSWLRAQ